ncbi:TadE/TadG family type IV pilus assembly protein [Actinomadura roseirufa]|uniref:TadE/TadG family type IV pilus assembly protein n=1 Tax=Actinomadura roseirufa TaxID=2094049 RepID=UPI0010414937|nr:TadE family protein [Actinomadura roseirufa]
MAETARARRPGRERGSATLEFAGLLPMVLILILFCFEALMASTSVERVENAARTGAREAAKAHDRGVCVRRANAAMPGWLNDRTVRGGEPYTTAVSCRVRAKVPLLWPGVPLDFTVDRTVTMPKG